MQKKILILIDLMNMLIHIKKNGKKMNYNINKMKYIHIVIYQFLWANTIIDIKKIDNNIDKMNKIREIINNQ